MKKGIKKAISTIAILTMTFQIGMPMIPGVQTTVLATDTTNSVEEVQEDIQPTVDKVGTTELSENADTLTEEISRNYQIKEEETWDVSKNGDGSVIAKWTLEDRTLTISGTGEMKNWTSNSEEDWHNVQYSNMIEKVIINEQVKNIGNYAFASLKKVINVEIPNTVTSVGEYAFYWCDNLRSIEIPSSVTSIGERLLLPSWNTETIIYCDAGSEAEKYAKEKDYLYVLNEERIVEVSSGEQLKKVADEVNGGDSYLGRKVILVADIDLQSINNWNPIGSRENPFKGEFNGNGYSISGMKITSNNMGYVGLFGYIKNTMISNVKLKNSNINISNINQSMAGFADAEIGLIVGSAYLDGSIGYPCEITNCVVENNCEIVLENSDDCIVGGIIGQASERITIENCKNSGTIKTSSNNAGGIVRIWNKCNHKKL